MSIIKTLKKIALSDRKRIAVGIVDRRKIKLIKNAEKYAEVLIVSSSPVEGEKNSIFSENPADELMSMLLSGEVDGIVRGDISAKEFKSKLPFNEQRAVLLKLQEYEFYMGPVGIDEGVEVEDRVDLAKKLFSLLKKLGLNPALGVLSKGRIEDEGRSEEVDKSLSEGKLITEKLSELNAFHYGILIEEAVKHSNIIICPDGVSGNLLFRAMVLAGNATGWGAPYTGEYIVVDTSRSSPYLANAIIHASALAVIKDRYGTLWD